MNMESGVGESLIKTGLKRASTARQYHTSLCGQKIGSSDRREVAVAVPPVGAMDPTSNNAICTLRPASCSAFASR